MAPADVEDRNHQNLATAAPGTGLRRPQRPAEFVLEHNLAPRSAAVLFIPGYCSCRPRHRRIVAFDRPSRGHLHRPAQRCSSACRLTITRYRDAVGAPDQNVLRARPGKMGPVP
jgi:hypothetical protein